MKNKNKTIILKYVVSPLVMAILIFILTRQLLQQKDLHQRWEVIADTWKSPFLYLVFLMMFVNWGLEAYKWKILVSPLEKLSFTRAYLSVLTGCAITLLTPNRTGEFAGRISWLKPNHRISGIAAAMLGSLSQLIVTFILGFVGLCSIFFFYPIKLLPVENLYLQWMSLFFVLLISIILLIIFFNPSRMIRLFKAFDFTRKWVRYVDVLAGYQRKDLLRILCWSILRYAVFILQYIIVMKLFITDSDVADLLALTAVFYLLVTIAPTIGLLELPVRAGVGVMLFGLVTDNILGIEVAALLVWIINLMIPSLIGTFLMGYSINKIAQE